VDPKPLAPPACEPLDPELPKPPPEPVAPPGVPLLPVLPPEVPYPDEAPDEPSPVELYGEAFDPLEPRASEPLLLE
jgi:hypothetical protein